MSSYRAMYDAKMKRREIQETIKEFLEDDIKPFLEYYKIAPEAEEFLYWKKRKEKWEKRLKKG